MNTARDIVSITTTAGPSVDANDPIEKKAAFLEEQVALFGQDNAMLLRENRSLALENRNLKNQLEDTPPKPELSEQTALILKYFLAKAAKGASDGEIACHFQIPMSIVTRHTYMLWKKNFIAGNGLVLIGSRRNISEPMCAITVEGRAYCVENGLAS